MTTAMVETRATKQTTAMAKSAPTPAENIKRILEDKLPAIREVQTKYITAERAVKLACMAVNGDAKLQNCTPLSILQSVVTSVQLGLELGGPLQHCWLVPYGSTCQLLVGYRGLVNLARRSREIAMIEARLVYSGERFEVTYGTEPGIVHVPDFESERKDAEIVAAYAVATLGNGHRQFEVMSRTEILKIANGKGGKVWGSDFGEMCRKTPTRRLCKYLPMTNEMALALGEEGEFVRTDQAAVVMRTRTAALDAPVQTNGTGRSHHPETLVPTRDDSEQPTDQADEAPPAHSAECTDRERWPERKSPAAPGYWRAQALAKAKAYVEAFPTEASDNTPEEIVKRLEDGHAEPVKRIPGPADKPDEKAVVQQYKDALAFLDQSPDHWHRYVVPL